jgi:hypothetical protein
MSDIQKVLYAEREIAGFNPIIPSKEADGSDWS